MKNENTRKCHCIVRHPQTDEEREQVSQALEAARSADDVNGTVIALAQLTQKCPAQEVQS